MKTLQRIARLTLILALAAGTLLACSPAPTPVTPTAPPAAESTTEPSSAPATEPTVAPAADSFPITIIDDDQRASPPSRSASSHWCPV